MECQWWLMYRSIMSSIVTEGSNPTASCSPAYYCHALHPTSPSSWTLWAKLVKKECTFRLTRSAFRILSGICESALKIPFLILEFGKRNSHLLQSLPNWLQNVSDWLLILTREPSECLPAQQACRWYWSACSFWWPSGPSFTSMVR